MVIFGRERNALRGREMKSRKEKAPTTGERKRTRGTGCTSIRKIVEQIERNYVAGEITPTATELLRLLELQRELAAEETKHIEVTWIEQWPADSEE